MAADLADGLGAVRLTLAADDGGDLPAWGRHRAAAAREITLPATPVRYVPLGGEMAFVGWEEAPSSAVPGDQVDLTAHLLALRPLTHDYSVSAGVAGRESDWEVLSYGTPAQGLLPTLKWLPVGASATRARWLPRPTRRRHGPE